MASRRPYAEDREYRGMYLKKRFFWYIKCVAWGVYYAEDCFAAIEMFETLPEAKAFVRQLIAQKKDTRHVRLY